MQYWSWVTGSSLLGPDEVLILSQNGVALYDGDKRTKWDKGKLLLTTHHLIYQAEDKDGSTLRLKLEDAARSGQDPVGTTGFAFKSDKIVVSLPAGLFVRLSFRDGGMSDFLEDLLKTLKRKQWAVVSPPAQSASPKPGAGGASASGSSATRATAATAGKASSPAPAPQETSSLRTADMVGIAGVVRASEESARMRDTFSDIDDVMAKASSVVAGIRQLQQKAASGTGEPNDALAIESIEATLGLGTMVPASSGSGALSRQSKFHAELGAELHAWMIHPRNAQLFGQMPFVQVIELFSLYNKARSGDLVSPEDVLMACKYMDKQADSHYALQTLSSGVVVLVNKDVSVKLNRLVPLLGPQLVNPAGPKVSVGASSKSPTPPPQHKIPATNTLPRSSLDLKSVNEAQLASSLQLTVPVARDILEGLERDGYLCRSDAGFGCCTYYWNVFVF